MIYARTERLFICLFVFCYFSREAKKTLWFQAALFSTLNQLLGFMAVNVDFMRIIKDVQNIILEN